MTGHSPAGYVPPGNVIGLRNEEEIAGGRDARGKSWRAVVVRDIIDGNGTILVAAGSEAQLRVMDFSEGDRSTKGEVQLALATVTINGQPHPVHAAEEPYGPLGTLVDSSMGLTGIMTKGDAVHVPAQTRMDFQTDDPLYVKTH